MFNYCRQDVGRKVQIQLFNFARVKSSIAPSRTSIIVISSLLESREGTPNKNPFYNHLANPAEENRARFAISHLDDKFKELAKRQDNL